MADLSNNTLVNFSALINPKKTFTNQNVIGFNK